MVCRTYWLPTAYKGWFYLKKKYSDIVRVCTSCYSIKIYHVTNNVFFYRELELKRNGRKKLEIIGLFYNPFVSYHSNFLCVVLLVVEYFWQWLYKLWKIKITFDIPKVIFLF